MSPTVFKFKSYRFFFFSLEEKRIHVHIDCPQGEAKFWLEPIIALADYHGLTNKQLQELQKVVEVRKNEISKAWKTHFKG